MEIFLLLLFVPFLFGDLFGGNDDDDDDTPPTIDGTEGDDALEGGSEGELINALDGDDAIRGHAGKDTLYGGAGADSMLGGTGNDHLHGDEGSDDLAGGTGDDLLVGDEGDDLLAGEDGKDTIFAGDDDDFVDGGEGNDTIWMGEGNDSLGTDVDADDPFTDPSEPGDDQIDGGDGDDEILDLAGRNVLTGGQGYDFLVAVDDRATDDPDNLFGGWGYDTLNGDDGDVLSGGEMVDEFGVYLDEATDQTVTITDFDAERETLELYVVADNFPDYVGGLSSGTDPLTGEVSLYLDGELVAVLQLTDPAAEFSLGRVNINFA